MNKKTEDSIDFIISYFETNVLIEDRIRNTLDYKSAAFIAKKLFQNLRNMKVQNIINDSQYDFSKKKLEKT